MSKNGKKWEKIFDIFDKIYTSKIDDFTTFKSDCNIDDWVI